MINRIASLFPADFDFKKHLLGAAYIGSTSHNTYVPKDNPDSIDDVDIMGIMVPPLRRVAGLSEWTHWVKAEEELDMVFYSLRKVMGLLLKGNPNVVGFLWLDPSLFIHRTPALDRLIAERDIFSSHLCQQSFVGYAASQIHKMENLAFKGYMGEKRKELVKRFGYDTKNASHAIRLLRMGVEFLQTGQLQVYRTTDAEELRSIKRGEWSLGKVKTEAEALLREAKSMKCKLPLDPNFERAEALMLEIFQEYWG